MAMDTPSQNMDLRLPLSSSIHAIFFLSCMSMNLLPSMSSTIFTNETDHLSLLAFKSQITQDPLGALTSWTPSLHFCNWSGITCGSLHPQRGQGLEHHRLNPGGQFITLHIQPYLPQVHQPLRKQLLWRHPPGSRPVAPPALAMATTCLEAKFQRISPVVLISRS